MTVSLIIVIIMGALFVGALLYLGAGKNVKPRPKKSDSFGPLVLILLPLMSWMAYTQINKDQYSLFNAYPALNYIVIAVFVGAFIWEKGKAKG